ncbi:hypothetical protein L596_008687 [Steinernema carpocapsae]|uniref:RRM domain-containing protein n=1 Tax=Steinernema carpocapsae TaxID=34508 RepID=A0A4U5PDC3_STECR|nr:hypothetical protein L596_008687 [Steinernema carpocapsae]
MSNPHSIALINLSTMARFNQRAPRNRRGSSKNRVQPRVQRNAAPPRPHIRSSKVTFTNLAFSVSSADLQELFRPYNPTKITLHFNESGRSLGVADVFVPRQEASKMVHDFKGITLDGRELKMTYVDEFALENRLSIAAPPAQNRTQHKSEFLGKKPRGRGAQKRRTM